MNEIHLKDNKDIIYRGVMFVLGIFMVSICYNMFFLPNDFVVGGSSGLSIIIEGVTGFDPRIFIYIFNIFLIILCYIFLGKEETKNTIIGSLLYPLFITFTTPIVAVIKDTFVFEEILVTVVLSGLLYGIGTATVYKCEFNTGGIDVLVKIVNKFFHVPEGKGLLILNGSLVLFGGFVFGVNKVVYTIIIIIISSFIVDKILIGISDSKMFLIYTRKLEEVSEVIKKFNTGYTFLPTEGGYSHKKGTIILCVFNTKDYIEFKKIVLKIDPDAFMVINDCYDVEGGIKRNNFSFI